MRISDWSSYVCSSDLQFVGGHSWTVPIFLFRYHADVESYLWTFARDADSARQIFGRFGSDFIGLSLGDDGEVVRLIAGERSEVRRVGKACVSTCRYRRLPYP